MIIKIIYLLLEIIFQIKSFYRTFAFYQMRDCQFGEMEYRTKERDYIKNLLKLRQKNKISL